MMQLYDNAASPFCRKVKVLLREVGRESEVDLIPSGGNPLAKGTSPAAPNPLGKIPALVRDDGPAVYDSRVICRYLDARFSGGLYPESRIWEVLTLEATADGIMDAAVLVVYEARFRDADIRSEAWAEGQWDKVSRALDAIESRWMGHLAGKLDAGQIALACALGYLDFRHGARNWRSGRTALAAWFHAISKRPSMEATVPQG
jgi:glutathione S-transferase